MKMFIDDHREDHGVEPICEVLPIAPSTYYARAAITRNPDLASDRAKRDARLRLEVRRVWDDNYEVYGVRKVWRQMQRKAKSLRKLAADIQSTPQLAAALITSVNIKPGEIKIILNGEALGKHLDIYLSADDPDNSTLTITAPFQLRKRGQESKLIIGNEADAPERDTVLIRNIAKAHAWYNQIKQGRTFDQIADQENTRSATIRHNINLAFLAPDVVRQVMDGKQPIGLTSKYLFKHLPSMSWQKQRELFRTLQHSHTHNLLKYKSFTGQCVVLGKLYD
jgi:hypothetical protein